MYVYLLDGRVIEVPKATSVRVEEGKIVVYDGKNVAGRFPVRDVYFSSKVNSSPVPS